MAVEVRAGRGTTLRTRYARGRHTRHWALSERPPLRSAAGSACAAFRRGICVVIERRGGSFRAGYKTRLRVDVKLHRLTSLSFPLVASDACLPPVLALDDLPAARCFRAVLCSPPASSHSSPACDRRGRLRYPRHSRSSSPWPALNLVLRPVTPASPYADLRVIGDVSRYADFIPFSPGADAQRSCPIQAAYHAFQSGCVRDLQQTLKIGSTRASRVLAVFPMCVPARLTAVDGRGPLGFAALGTLAASLVIAVTGSHLGAAFLKPSASPCAVHPVMSADSRGFLSVR